MMKSVMASSKSQDSSSSSSTSKRHFHWTNKIGSEEEDHHDAQPQTLLKSTSTQQQQQQQELKDHIDYIHNNTTNTIEKNNTHQTCARRKLQQVAVARLRSAVLSALGRARRTPGGGGGGGLGTRVVGTLFGSRRGHVHFAFQRDPASRPALLVELATPISGLVREMASGLVRIALECDKKRDSVNVKRPPLLEESSWRTFCNGKKSGFAARRECGPRDWKILKAVEPISMGAGVLPHHHDHDGDGDGGDGDGDGDDEVMYMRAKFERVVGSRDSEAFYMMNPDSNGAPELSIYLLRV